MRLRLLLATISVGVGCGSFSEPPGPGEPAPGPAPAPSEQAEGRGEAAPSQVTTDPPPPGSGAATPATPGCKVGFKKDVLPTLVTTCGQAACHGGQTSRPFIEADVPDVTHQELMDFEFGSIEWSDPHSEVSGANTPDVKKVIDAWRLCGAKLD